MTITIPRTYQGMCWHCVGNYMIEGFQFRVERGGLRCPLCRKLNCYQWTKAEYEQMKKDYKQHDPK